jgi:hypothetical protein
MKLFLLLTATPLVFGEPTKSTYAMSYPFAYKAFLEKYLPTAENLIQKNDTSKCAEWVKLCIDDGAMTSCGGPWGNDFQLHSVGAYKRDAGSKTMEQIEIEWSKSMGAMDRYDPFFDFNFGVVTEDLDTYIAAFDDDKVPYFASTFMNPETKEEYKSILVQVPGSLADGAKSLLSLEIMAKSSVLLSGRSGLHHHSLTRASPDALARAEAHFQSTTRKVGANGKPVLKKVHLSFASSDLDRDIKYFEGVLQGSKVFEADTSEGKMYAGKMISSDETEFVYRESSIQTQGPTSVAQWEAYQSGLHKTCLNSADNNGFDRLADNHGENEAGENRTLDTYIKAQKSAGLPYRFYSSIPGSSEVRRLQSGPGNMFFLYVYGPNGWGMQLIGACQDASLCPATTPAFYDMCTQGIKGHCDHDGNSTIVV